MGILYRLDFPSGRSYIGITIQKLSTRIRNHRAAANSGETPVLYKAWRKYGNPKVVVLAIVENHLLHDAEVKAIALFDTFRSGYNSTPGGDGKGKRQPPHTAEWKAAASARMLGELNPMKDPAVVARYTASTVGRKQPPGFAAKISAANKGRIKSPETKARLSAALKGRKLSDSHKARMALVMLGKRHTPETRRKMAEATRARNLRKSRGNHTGQASFDL